MSQFQERYRPVVIGVNATVTLPATSNIGGFLATATGTLTVVDSKGVTVINAVAVTAGIYTPMPFQLAGGGTPITVTTASSAAGTLGVY